MVTLSDPDLKECTHKTISLSKTFFVATVEKLDEFQTQSRRHAPTSKKRLSSLLKQVNLYAAGIDVGATEHFVVVPEGLDDHPICSSLIRVRAIMSNSMKTECSRISSGGQNKWSTHFYLKRCWLENDYLKELTRIAP